MFAGYVGVDHSIALKQDGSVWTTGVDWYGQLGVDNFTFEQVISGNAVALDAGIAHSVALMNDGSVWTTGLNRYGQLGDKTLENNLLVRSIGHVRQRLDPSAHNVMLK